MFNTILLFECFLLKVNISKRPPNLNQRPVWPIFSLSKMVKVYQICYPCQVQLWSYNEQIVWFMIIFSFTTLYSKYDFRWQSIWQNKANVQLPQLSSINIFFFSQILVSQPVFSFIFHFSIEFLIPHRLVNLTEKWGPLAENV